MKKNRQKKLRLNTLGLTPLSLTSVGAKTRTSVGKPKQRDIIIVLHELATLLT
jgi:type II secretory pathway component PulF